jgi:Lar family restriction alleviation protein
MSMLPKLLPCPFCGNDYLKVVQIDEHREAVECFVCNTTGPTAYSILKACEIWNERLEVEA